MTKRKPYGMVVADANTNFFPTVDEVAELIADSNKREARVHRGRNENKGSTPLLQSLLLNMKNIGETK